MKREDILDCAEKAGFGGMLRVTMYPRLAKFADLISELHQQQLAGMCNELGDAFQLLSTEFSEGQMDGAYQCAEIVKYAKP